MTPAGSDLELELAFQIRVMKLPPPALQYKAIPNRQFKCDFAWPDLKIALEVDGAQWGTGSKKDGTWHPGRHGSGSGIETDCEKQNWLVTMGWHTLRVTKDQIQSGMALKWLQMTIHLVEEEQA